MGFERMFVILLIVTLILTVDAVVRVIYAEITTSDELNNSSLSMAFLSGPSNSPSSPVTQNDTISSRPTNPHWDKSQCHVCHDDMKNISSPDRLSTVGEALCFDCHKNDLSHIYIHPVGIMLSNNKKVTFSKRWRGNLRLDSNNRLICQTCHDLLDQCLPERAHQVERNPRFLRGGPYPNRYALCYRCHDSEKYQRNNPHDQIADNGILKINKCRLCHEVDIDINIQSGIEKDLEKYPLLKGTNDDRTLLCVRCHQKIDHPSSAFRVSSDKQFRHLVKIKDDKKITLEKQIKLTGIVLPLEPHTERIYCGTCHQPHQSGVFLDEDRSSAIMKNHRLRSRAICKHCHDIYGSLLESGKEE